MHIRGYSIMIRGGLSVRDSIIVRRIVTFSGYKPRVRVRVTVRVGRLILHDLGLPLGVASRSVIISIPDHMKQCIIPIYGNTW